MSAACSRQHWRTLHPLPLPHAMHAMTLGPRECSHLVTPHSPTTSLDATSGPTPTHTAHTRLPAAASTTAAALVSAVAKTASHSAGLGHTSQPTPQLTRACRLQPAPDHSGHTGQRERQAQRSQAVDQGGAGPPPSGPAAGLPGRICSQPGSCGSLQNAPCGLPGPDSCAWGFCGSHGRQAPVCNWLGCRVQGSGGGRLGR